METETKTRPCCTTCEGHRAEAHVITSQLAFLRMLAPHIRAGMRTELANVYAGERHTDVAPFLPGAGGRIARGIRTGIVPAV